MNNGAFLTPAMQLHCRNDPIKQNTHKRKKGAGSKRPTTPLYSVKCYELTGSGRPYLCCAPGLRVSLREWPHVDNRQHSTGWPLQH